MLTNDFSCYNVQALQQIHPFQRENKSSIAKYKDCQIFFIIQLLGYSNIGVHSFQKEKSNISYFFTHAFRKKLSLIILVQRLHSIIRMHLLCIDIKC